MKKIVQIKKELRQVEKEVAQQFRQGQVKVSPEQAQKIDELKTQLQDEQHKQIFG